MQDYLSDLYIIFTLILMGLLTSLLAFFVLLSRQIDFGGSTWMETGIPLFVSQGFWVLFLSLLIGLYAKVMWMESDDDRGILSIKISLVVVSMIAMAGASLAFPVLILLYLDGWLPHEATLAHVFIPLWLYQGLYFCGAISNLLKVIMSGYQLHEQLLYY